MNTYADDLATLVEELDLKNAIHIGHSTGGGEVARHIGRHGSKRVAMAVLIGAVPPLMLKTAANPGGLPMEAFDQIRAGVLNDRSQFFQDLSIPFYGANRPGNKVSQGLRDSFWLQGMLCGHKPLTIASRPSPKPTSRKISRRSMCRLLFCTVTTIRSCPSPTPRCFRRSWSKAPR
jgi:pimeloyl-ACP methyl ester carboxylesterase